MKMTSHNITSTQNDVRGLLVLLLVFTSFPLLQHRCILVDTHVGHTLPSRQDVWSDTHTHHKRSRSAFQSKSIRRRQRPSQIILKVLTGNESFGFVYRDVAPPVTNVPRRFCCEIMFNQEELKEIRNTCLNVDSLIGQHALSRGRKI